jgi:hypothetical protein
MSQRGGRAEAHPQANPDQESIDEWLDTADPLNLQSFDGAGVDSGDPGSSIRHDAPRDSYLTRQKQDSNVQQSGPTKKITQAEIDAYMERRR